jgi:hypothetical protein
MQVNSLQPSNLFDLEILLPIHPEGKWLDRMESFRRFGLLGGEQRRVRLVLLSGTSSLDPALSDPAAWAGIESVAVGSSNSDYAAAKIYNYYGNVLAEQGLQARWYLRVDDDSLTDIDRLLDHLDTTYDWHDPLHLSGALLDDTQEPYLKALHDLVGERFVRGAGHCEVFHEWEHSLTSHAAMSRIVADPSARAFLRSVALLPDGYGDHCLSYAARIVGIPLACVPFMSPHCQLDRFATFAPSGDGFFHIHYLSPDNPEMWRSYMNHRHSLGLFTECT